VKRSKSYGPDRLVACHDRTRGGGIRLAVCLRTSLRQDLKGNNMIALTWLTAIVTVLLLVYLFAALVRPEWF
jgi:K+-transporting ATPase KdpF subunit